jgi:hypothetical protein
MIGYRCNRIEGGTFIFTLTLPDRAWGQSRISLRSSGLRYNYSAFSPAALMIGPHLAISALKKASHSSGELPTGT